MNRLTMCCVAALAVAAGAAASAQDKMAKPMEMGKEKSYTGCIEAGAMAGSFKLTHAEAAMAMGAMGKDSMKKDTMGKDAMKKDAMMPTMALMGKGVDLSKHVGHKVTVTGADDKMAMAKDAMGKDMNGFTVTALKMVAATCGK